MCENENEEDEYEPDKGAEKRIIEKAQKEKKKGEQDREQK